MAKKKNTICYNNLTEFQFCDIISVLKKAVLMLWTDVADWKYSYLHQPSQHKIKQ